MKKPLALALALWLAAGTSFAWEPRALGHVEGPIPDALQQPPETTMSAWVKGPGAPAPLAGRPGVWLRFSNHNHTGYWDGRQSLGHMQVAAFSAGLDAMAVTDHNTMRGTTSHEYLHPPEGLIMVKGMEWNAWNEHGQTVVGHANLLGMTGDKPIRPTASLDEMLAEAARRDATIIINHPFCWRLSWQQAEPDPRAHAVEVWNGWWYLVKPLMNNDSALAWWEQALRKGRRLTAVAGTDNHGQVYDHVARNVNMVFAETADEAGILKAVREGRVTITSGVEDGAVYLEGDRDDDGTFDTMMGDVLPRPRSGRLTVRARVLGASGQQVAFYTARGRVAVKRVEGPNATIPLTVPLGDGHDYVRAELRPNADSPLTMTSLTNPIYVEPPAPTP
ncbi:PHP domain protein [compost metagenome]